MATLRILDLDANEETHSGLQAFLDANAETHSGLQAFLDANAETPLLCDNVLALRPGDSLDVGGGAAPRIRITRTGKKGRWR